MVETKICPTCVALGLTSKVFPANSDYVALHFEPYYDEAGVLHSLGYCSGGLDGWHAGTDDNNTGYYVCSHGHGWHE